jgi:class 3 adenylate cyclase
MAEVTVSVLVTDLVGSTDLAPRVRPVVADELRHEHFRLRRRAIPVCRGGEVETTSRDAGQRAGTALPDVAGKAETTP